MNENQLLALALQNDFDSEIAVYNNMPNHFFSLRFRKRMKRLMNVSGVPYWELKRIPLKKSITIALVAVILLAFFTGATLMIYRPCDKFRLQDAGEHTYLVAFDTEGAPTTLEEKYRLGIDLSGYSENLLFDDEYDYLVEYHEENGNRLIAFSQSIKSHYQDESYWLYTENAMVMPTEIIVNGNKYIFFQTKYGDMCLIWDCGDYIIEVGTYGFGKDELISMAETVHKVE